MTEMELKAEVASLRNELATLRDLIAGGDLASGVNRLAQKIERQRQALDRLHTRVVNQRFHLRTLDELGRGLTKDEYETARAAVTNEQVKDRLVGVIA